MAPQVGRRLSDKPAHVQPSRAPPEPPKNAQEKRGLQVCSIGSLTPRTTEHSPSKRSQRSQRRPGRSPGRQTAQRNATRTSTRAREAYLPSPRCGYERAVLQTPANAHKRSAQHAALSAPPSPNTLSSDLFRPATSDIPLAWAKPAPPFALCSMMIRPRPADQAGFGPFASPLDLSRVSQHPDSKIIAAELASASAASVCVILSTLIVARHGTQPSTYS